jgi:hypothetical protein
MSAIQRKDDASKDLIRNVFPGVLNELCAIGHDLGTTGPFESVYELERDHSPCELHNLGPQLACPERPFASFVDR